MNVTKNATLSDGTNLFIGNCNLNNPIELILKNIISLFDVFKSEHTIQYTTATPSESLHHSVQFSFSGPLFCFLPISPFCL